MIEEVARQRFARAGFRPTKREMTRDLGGVGTPV
jgi:hypothetical protein